jgi:hypothetical protein
VGSAGRWLIDFALTNWACGCDLAAAFRAGRAPDEPGWMELDVLRPQRGAHGGRPDIGATWPPSVGASRHPQCGQGCSHTTPRLRRGRSVEGPNACCRHRSVVHRGAVQSHLRRGVGRDRGAQMAGRARPLWTLGEIGRASSGSVRRPGVLHDSRRFATTCEVTSDGRSDRISRGGTTNQAQ